MRGKQICCVYLKINFKNGEEKVINATLNSSSELQKLYWNITLEYITGNKILMLKLNGNYKMVLISSDSLENQKSLYLPFLLLNK